MCRGVAWSAGCGSHAGADRSNHRRKTVKDVLGIKPMFVLESPPKSGLYFYDTSGRGSEL
jgi:hypothetical protein